MSERIILTIATGTPDFGNMAINLALSIKANTPAQKVGVIYTDGAMDGLMPLCEKTFDYGYRVSYYEEETPQALAYRLKTELYSYAKTMNPDAEAYIFLDADTIILPGKNVNDWFDTLSGLKFTAYCNDIYHYSTKTRKRKDYTFWCDPEEARERYGIFSGAKIPQVNSSFLYWEPCEETEKLFKKVSEVYADDYCPQVYKTAKPDELAFNIACALTGLYPHKNTYRPLFFQCFSSYFETEYIHHFFGGFGFAGNGITPQYLIDFYNEHVRYYRQHFAVIAEWQMKSETKSFKDPSPLAIQPIRRGTLYREGELPNSSAGVFNPDGVILKDGTRITIFRKEASFDAYKKYAKTTAIPHVHVMSPDKRQISAECEFIIEENARAEDFRLFQDNDNDLIWCNHSVVSNNHTSEISVSVAVQLLAVTDRKAYLLSPEIPNLPIEVKQVEKNWVFFIENNKVYCIYSLQPYTLFSCKKFSLRPPDLADWEPVPVEQPEIDWVHKGHAISNSTNPILIGDYYLMFFHTKESGIYYKGAVLIDKETKNIAYYTKHSFPFPARNDGWQKGLHYISGSWYDEKANTVRVFYGENDSHACYMDYDVTELIETIKQQ